MKKFVLRTILFFSPVLLLLINYAILSAYKDVSGDIGITGHYFFEKNYHNRVTTFYDSDFVSDVYITELPDSCGILCFGDSFSNSRPYRYQNEVGKSLNSRVYNVLWNINISPALAALSFLKNAPKEKMPKIIIIESVERYMTPGLNQIDFNNIPPLELLFEGKKHSTISPRKKLEDEITSYYQRLIKKDSKFFINKLDNYFFSINDHPDRLYCYHEDTIHYSAEQFDNAIKNISKLHRIAANHNVHIFYLAVPNKSNVYANHIIGQHHYYTPLDNPTLFDTMPYVFSPLTILRDQLDNDSLDVYYADDTHWTPKTAKLVGFLLSEIIQNKKIITSDNRQ